VKDKGKRFSLFGFGHSEPQAKLAGPETVNPENVT